MKNEISIPNKPFATRIAFIAMGLIALLFISCTELARTTPSSKTFTVIFNLNGGIVPTSGTPTISQTVANGKKASKPANPTKTAAPNAFVNWYSKNNPTPADTPFDFTTAITTDITLYAGWGYTVIFDKNGGDDPASGAVSDQIILSGGTVVAPADDPTPSAAQTHANFTKLEWQKAGSRTKFNFGVNTITTNTTIIAIWKQ